MQKATAIFSPYKIGKLELRNRLVALPVYTGYAYADGRASDMLIDHYRQLAASGVAVVTVANAAVSSDGVVAQHNLRIDGDEFIPGLERLAHAIHREKALACLQLNHGGRFAATERPLLPSPVDGSNLTFNIASLKNFMTFFPLEKRFRLTRSFINQTGKWRRGMTAADIGRVIVDFGAAAARACRAGFDMLEIHGANGYLVCQFLSGFTNRCETTGIQNIDHRMSIPLAILREIKRRVPPDFPVGFRLLLREWVPDGIDLAEALQIADALQKEGVAYLSASVGTYNSIFSEKALRHMARAGYLEPDMRRLKEAASVPTIISGRVVHPRIAERLIRDGAADLVGLGRPLRVDAQWVDKARRGDDAVTLCSNCNGCLKQVVMDRGFVCMRWSPLQQDRVRLDRKLLSRNYRTLWVVSRTRDLDLFRLGAARVLRGTRLLTAGTEATIFYIEKSGDPAASEQERSGFLEWCRANAGQTIFESKVFSQPSVGDILGLSQVVQAEIDAGNYGMIFFGRNPRQAWQERILFRERGKILMLLGSHANQQKVLVPVDLSDATLMVMTVLHRIYGEGMDTTIRFVHVVKEASIPEERRWQDLVKASGFQGDNPLQILQGGNSVAAEILAVAKRENFGMVVMGKRGMSGIKRWMLGSVSMGVLRGLGDRTLMLID